MPENNPTKAHTNGVREPKTSEVEVVPRAKRRSFTAAYKLQIVKEADACTERGEIGALLRREGLYSSHLSAWRRLREKGQLDGLRTRTRGRKKTKRDKAAEELQTLRQEKEALERRLAQAETVIDVQKKLYTLLGLTQTNDPNGEAR